jgi:hypothetical protein
MRSVAAQHAHRLSDGGSTGRADVPGISDAPADESRMESVTRSEPTAAEPKTSDVKTAAAPERGLSRQALVAELERVVSQAKTDSKRWEQRAGTVTDDLLPSRRS